jgi:hypothetical protein
VLGIRIQPRECQCVGVAQLVEDLAVRCNFVLREQTFRPARVGQRMGIVHPVRRALHMRNAMPQAHHLHHQQRAQQQADEASVLSSGGEVAGHLA